jgi:hypothetical protein
VAQNKGASGRPTIASQRERGKVTELQLTEER